jgi:hypothetical protein
MAMKKAEIDDIVMLSRWAIENALDQPLEAERREDIPPPERKRPPRKRIKLGRIRRAKLRVNLCWPTDRPHISGEDIRKLSRNYGRVVLELPSRY